MSKPSSLLCVSLRLTFFSSLQQFAGQKTESILKPNIVGSSGQPITTMDDEAAGDGHGTAMAALVNGNTLGIAKKATVVGVKFEGAKAGQPGDVFDAWMAAIQDVNAKQREGKTVFVIAYSESSFPSQ